MIADPWPAPTPTRPVDAVVNVPGSKSQTARALVLAALSDGASTLRGALRARDTQLMVDGLRALGTTVDDADDQWQVRPHQVTAPATVDCGLAGTVMRFLPPVAALADGPVTFDGDPRARERPVGPLLQALRDLGVQVDDDGRGALPFTVHGKGSVRGGHVEVDTSASSQFLSALLLVGCRYDEGLEVVTRGAVPSRPHVDMTVAALRASGVDVDDSVDGRWVVAPGVPRPGRLTIEPDLSNAMAFLAAALATRGTVRVEGWPTTTTQPGDDARRILALFGADVVLDESGLTVRCGGPIHGVDIDLGHAGELTPVVAALCALADSPSTLRGVAHLRGHETDRLAALTREIRALGGDVDETDDGLVLRPRALRGGVFSTHDDHRMAQAGAVLGLSVPGVLVEDVATTGKTLPDFVERWTGMLG